MTKSSLVIGLSLSATWLSGQGWRKPDSRVEELYSAGYFQDLAAQAEAQKVDFLFRPDALALNLQGVAEHPGFSSLDPTIQLTAVAQTTRHIGLVTTLATTFYPPYIAARQLESLNWVSGGRAGWNIVTGLDGHQNFGLAHMPPPPERYEKADEFVQVVHQLWHSYPQQALTIERDSGQYVNSELIREINHTGQNFRVQGPLNLPAYSTQTMPLFQAGASETGRQFAARYANGIFASIPDKTAGIALRSDLHRRAISLGRAPTDIRLLPGLHLFLGESIKEAADEFATVQSTQAVKRALTYIKEQVGLDLSGYNSDQQVKLEMLPNPPPIPKSQTHAELLRRLIAKQPRVGELLRSPEAAGSAHWRVIGTPDEAVKTIRDWHEAGAADGFIALPGSVRSLQLFLDEVMPRLRSYGLAQEDYRGVTFSENLGITGHNPHLPGSKRK